MISVQYCHKQGTTTEWFPVCVIPLIAALENIFCTRCKKILKQASYFSLFCNYICNGGYIQQNYKRDEKNIPYPVAPGSYWSSNVRYVRTEKEDKRQNRDAGVPRWYISPIQVGLLEGN